MISQTDNINPINHHNTLNLNSLGNFLNNE